MTDQTREPVRLDTPEDLRALMGATHAASDEQWAAITSPLRPEYVVDAVQAQTGTISGMVTDAGTQRPVPSARVEVVDGAGQAAGAAMTLLLVG